MGTGHMEVFGSKLWAIRLALEVMIEQREILPRLGLMMVAVFSDSQAAI